MREADGKKNMKLLIYPIHIDTGDPQPVRNSDMKYREDTLFATLSYAAFDGLDYGDGLSLARLSDDRFYVLFDRTEPRMGMVQYVWSIYIEAGARFDHETDPRAALDVAIVFDDAPAARPHVSATYTLDIPDVNEAPTIDGTENMFRLVFADAPRGETVLTVLDIDDPDAADDDPDTGDPDNRFGEFEARLTAESSPGLTLRENEEGKTELIYTPPDAETLRYITLLKAEIEVADNPDAPAEERNIASGEVHVSFTHPLELVAPPAVATDEEATMIFGEVYGNALAVFGANGALLTATLEVAHGRLTTDGQKVGDYATESAINPESGKHEITFTDIDEHDLTALLEGLTYTPDVDYYGLDTLEINVSRDGQTHIVEVPITVNPIDDAGEIVNYGDPIINYGVENTVYRRAELIDPDGYDVAGGKLHVRITDRMSWAIERSESQHAPAPLIALDGLSRGQAGVFQVGTLVKYRYFEDGTAKTLDIADISSQTEDGPPDVDSPREYSFDFRTNPDDSGLTDAEWEAKLKDALDDLLESIEYIGGDFEAWPPFLSHVIEDSEKHLIAARFEDGVSGETTDEAAILAVSDGYYENFDWEAFWEDFVLTIEIKAVTITIDRDDWPTIPSRYVNNFRDSSERLPEDEAAISERIVDAMTNPERIWSKAQTRADEDPDGSLIIRYFLATDDDGLTSDATSTPYIPLWESHPAAIEKAMAAIANVADIDFQRVHAPEDAELVFVQNNSWYSYENFVDDNDGGAAYRKDVISLPWDAHTGRILRELAEVIGLRHQMPSEPLDLYIWEPGDGEFSSYIPYSEANFDNTIMTTREGSYESGWSWWPSSINFSIIALPDPTPHQLQIYDILALQAAYGLNTETNGGDTLYQFPSARNNYGGEIRIIIDGEDVSAELSEVGDDVVVIPRRGSYTVYDRGGIDTIDLSDRSKAELDLMPGAHSRITWKHDFAIAYGTIIENAIGTDYNDNIYGNDADNILEGGLGKDILNGRGGSDTASYQNAFRGVRVDLSLPKGIQPDDADSDEFYFDADRGALIISPVTTASGDQLISIENLIGSAHDDVLLGDEGDNVLEGGGGADILNGRAGNDTASYRSSSEGVRVDLTLADGIQPDDAGGDASGDRLIRIENLIGSDHDDTLIGNRDHNRLEGLGGDDTLTGGGGKDVFVVEFGDGKGHDTITDWQYGVDTLIVQVDAALADLSDALRQGVIDVRQPDEHTYEVFMTAAPETDYFTVQFHDSIGEAVFVAALGGVDFLEVEIV